MSNAVILPTKLSDLLKLAMADYDKTKHDPKYEIDMRTWCRRWNNEIPCQVCLAGTVLVKTLAYYPRPGQHLTLPQMASCENLYQLTAVDDLRGGFITSAIESMLEPVLEPYLDPALRERYLELIDGEDYILVEVTPHQLDPLQWEKDMRDTLLPKLIELGI